MPDFCHSLGQGRIKPVVCVLHLQIFDNRPASGGNRQKDRKRQGGYYSAGVCVVKRKIMRADSNLRLRDELLGNRKAIEYSHQLIAVSLVCECHQGAGFPDRARFLLNAR